MRHLVNGCFVLFLFLVGAPFSPLFKDKYELRRDVLFVEKDTLCTCENAAQRC